MTDFPDPTNRLTAANVTAAADCIEFLVAAARAAELSEDDLERFQDTNWNTLVWSMRGWAFSLEVAETVQRNTVKKRPRNPFCFGEGQCTNPDHEGLVCHTHGQPHTPVSQQAIPTDSNSKREES